MFPYGLQFRLCDVGSVDHGLAPPYDKTCHMRQPVARLPESDERVVWTSLSDLPLVLLERLNLGGQNVYTNTAEKAPPTLPKTLKALAMTTLDSLSKEKASLQTIR